MQTKKQLQKEKKVYRDTNKGAVKATNKKYYESNKETINAKRTDYHEKNKDKFVCTHCNYHTHLLGDFNKHKKSIRHETNLLKGITTWLNEHKKE